MNINKQIIKNYYTTCFQITFCYVRVFVDRVLWIGSLAVCNRMCPQLMDRGKDINMMDSCE